MSHELWGSGENNGDTLQENELLLISNFFYTAQCAKTNFLKMLWRGNAASNVIFNLNV